MKKLFLFLAVILLTAAKHEYYVSVSEISYNEKRGELELSIKVFSDDLEVVLKDFSKNDVRLVKGGEEVDSLLKSYFEKHIFTTADAKVVRWKYLGHIANPDETNVFFSAGVKPLPAKIQIGLNHLMEKYSGQVNILHAKLGEIKRSEYFENPKELKYMTFK